MIHCACCANRCRRGSYSSIAAVICETCRKKIAAALSLYPGWSEPIKVLEVSNS